MITNISFNSILFCQKSPPSKLDFYMTRFVQKLIQCPLAIELLSSKKKGSRIFSWDGLLVECYKTVNGNLRYLCYPLDCLCIYI